MTGETSDGAGEAGMRARLLVGTGGIGYGRFFAMNGDRTLGREESRAGRFLERRDYCKLHIIAHVVRVLAGPALRVVPVGRVGVDAEGERLLGEMQAVGLDVTHVQRDPDHPTLSCICLVYPDGSGGNLTVDNSACAHMTASDIRCVEGDLAEAGRGAMVLAAPEVPMEVRAELLRIGSAHGCFRVASFISGEMAEARDMDLFRHVDLLALNRDEAAVLAEVPADRPPAEIARACFCRLREMQPEAWLSMTAGREGSWLLTGPDELFIPAVSGLDVKSTAGAGDAHLGGLLTALALGGTPEQALEWATLAAAYSVTSEHTIHPDLNRESLQHWAAARGEGVSVMK